jgi:ribosome biogenesis GTPase A
MRSFREKFNIASELADAIQPLADAPESVLTQECRLQAAALAEKCRRHLFYFVFLGQFKRGKTTLINSLLGRPLLPSGVLPLTAVVTFVRRGERTAACVRRLNGELEEIRIEDIPLYVTETANPNNRKQVAAVEVWTETVPFAENICLVDTPGIGSLYEHNTRVAYEFVQRADAAVFVLSPESPLTVAELEFLEHVRRHVEKIFFVLNKADQIDAAEREQLLAFIRQAAKLPAEAKLFALSAQRALQLGGQDSDFLVFRRALEEFFENHSAQLFVRSSVAALRRIVAQERLRLELEYQALRLDQDELNARIARIEEQWKRLEVRRTEVSYILRGELAALEQSVWDRLQRWVEDERYECTREVLEKARSVPAGSRQQCVMLIERRLEESLQGRLQQWQQRVEELFRQECTSRLARFSQEAAGFLADVQAVAAEQFGFSGPAEVPAESFELGEGIFLEVDRLVNWGLGRWVMLLPGPWFMRALEARLAEAVPMELRRAAGRLREAFGEQLDRLQRESWQEFERRIRETQQAIRDVLERAQRQHAATQQVREQRERELAEAERLLQTALQTAAAIEEARSSQSTPAGFNGEAWQGAGRSAPPAGE